MILKNIISKFITQTREKIKPQEIKIKRQEWRQASLILVLGRKRQEDFMFKAVWDTVSKIIKKEAKINPSLERLKIISMIISLLAVFYGMFIKKEFQRE